MGNQLYQLLLVLLITFVGLLVWDNSTVYTGSFDEAERRKWEVTHFITYQTAPVHSS